MRELLIDGLSSAASDLGYTYRDSVIKSHCQELLLRLELNLTDSEITLEAVKWAISELQCIEDDQWSDDGGGSSSSGPRINLARWRIMLIEAGGRMDETEPNFGSQSTRARVGKFVFSTALKEAVMSAAGGGAGRRMAELIDARLELPDCVHLTKLISHCLLVSMDQTPTTVVRASIGSSVETSDWMWLHRFLVRTIIWDNSYTVLDWLVGYMTASRVS
ncbi:hypothetical protein R1flu_014616 [Riccia fluitans]|uniref:Uncharacterized protein n=1 Tax=Riccia fluitans TaxID=41844 RepID=A0ABD1YGY3_9MARC